jgi:hypothetical protein
MSLLKRLFCLHPALKSEEYKPYGFEAETRIVYENPWGRFARKDTRYICNRCGKKYWYPSGEQMFREIEERNYNLLKK